MMLSTTVFSEVRAVVLPVARLTAKAFLSVVHTMMMPELVSSTLFVSEPVILENSFSSMMRPDSVTLTKRALTPSSTKQKTPSEAQTRSFILKRLVVSGLLEDHAVS